MLALALSLVSAVGLELTAPPDLPGEDAQALAAQIRQALGAHPTAQTTEGEIVRYVVDVGATRLQVLAERVQGGVVVARAAQVGPRDPEQWWRPAVALVDALYGPPTVEPSAVRVAGKLVTEAPPPAVVTPWPSWALLGTGGAMLVAGVAFGISSATARSELSQRDLVVEPELSELTGRADGHGAVAIALSAGAVACAVAGVVWMMSAGEE